LDFSPLHARQKTADWKAVITVENAQFGVGPKSANCIKRCYVISRNRPWTRICAQLSHNQAFDAPGHGLNAGLCNPLAILEKKYSCTRCNAAPLTL
jgi:hypothetical protein